MLMTTCRVTLSRWCVPYAVAYMLETNAYFMKVISTVGGLWCPGQPSLTTFNTILSIIALSSCMWSHFFFEYCPFSRFFILFYQIFAAY